MPMFDYQATVKRIIDGDTLEVTVDLGFRLFATMPVRLFGINTPETNSKDPVERATANLAKKFVDSMTTGKQLRIHTVKPKDKYGRWLAEIWVIGEWLQSKSINQQLIDNELARPWDGQGVKPV